jgi:hypothetical protein
MDKKISELDLVTTLDTGDVLPIVNQATTKKVTVAKLIDGLATTAYVNSQDALKVDKVVGKGLSTEDYTSAEKSKLAGIAEGAEVNVNADWNSVSGDSQILNKPTISGINTGDQNLQQVTDKGNAIVLPSNASRAIDITLPDLLGASSKGIWVTIEAQTGTYPNPDAYVARIKGQNPGSLANFISGFYSVATGADNYSFASEHNDGTVTSKHIWANNSASVTSDFIDFYTNYDINVFKIDYLGNVTATKFKTPTGTLSEYLMADGSVSTKITTTSQLTNNGADGVNPFITALDIPVAGQASTLVLEVKNMTGATLTKGTVVYISGANGNKALVSKALATNDALSSRTFGMLQSDILNNGLGNCVIIGNLSGLNTSSFTEGDQLYLSGVTAGTYTATKTLAPTHLVYVGKVTRSHPTLGQIEVGVQNGYELEEIHDVKIDTPANNEVLAYTSATDLWENKTPSEAGIQPTLVSTTNIKSINGNSILGGGDLTITATATVQSPFTMLANNSDVTAIPLEQVFKNIAEQTYSLSPTFTGTAPTTISSSTYQWNQVGTLVTVRVNLIYTTAGSITQVTIPLPIDMPTPLSPTGLSGALDILYYGVGMFNTATTTVSTLTRSCFLRRNATTGYEFVITHSTTLSSRVISLTLQYFTE